MQTPGHKRPDIEREGRDQRDAEGKGQTRLKLREWRFQERCLQGQKQTNRIDDEFGCYMVLSENLRSREL